MSSGTDEYTFLLTPGEDEALHVRFEPVGPYYAIEPGDHLRIRVRCPSADPVEVMSGNRWVTIWPAPSASLAATNARGDHLRFLT